MFKKPDKNGLLSAIVITVFLILLNTAGTAVTTLPLWPMSLSAIAFFMTGAQLKTIKNILLGAFTGLSLAAASAAAGDVLTPLLGKMPTYVLCLSFLLALIIIGGQFCNLIFNDVSFMYLVVAGLNPATLLDDFWLLTLVLLFGGLAIILGCYACLAPVAKFVQGRRASPKTKGL